jgi:aldehyde dehydrogenase (NAD+)
LTQSIAKFSSEEEVIRKANDTLHGLSAAIFTNNLNRAHRVSRALESGQVTVNAWAMLSANAPFGGVKESGFGRDMGEEALEGWTSVKTVKYMIM